MGVELEREDFVTGWELAPPCRHRVRSNTREERNKRMARCQATACSCHKILYHQTNSVAAESIVNQGKMHRGEMGLAGGGIYFAPTPRMTQDKTHHHGVVLVCRVRLGNTWLMKKDKLLLREDRKDLNFGKLIALGYDSLYIDCPKTGPEYVVYNWDQVEVLGCVPR